MPQNRPFPLAHRSSIVVPLGDPAPSGDCERLLQILSATPFDEVRDWLPAALRTLLAERQALRLRVSSGECRSP